MTRLADVPYLRGRNSKNLPDAKTYLAELELNGLRTEWLFDRKSPAARLYRQYVTKNDPLLFAIVYLRHMIQNKRGQATFGDMHLAICRWAFAHREAAAGEQGSRDVFVGSRRYGKSQWLLRIIPLWAAAHGHGSRAPKWMLQKHDPEYIKGGPAIQYRQNGPFIFFVAASDDAIKRHWEDVRLELEGNIMLKLDYPKLCTKIPSRRAQWISESGAIFLALSVESRFRGINIMNRDPDWILMDDMEVDGMSSRLIDQSQNMMERGIEMVAPDATMAIAGTTVNWRGIIHQLLMRTFENIVAIPEDILKWTARWDTHWFPPIVPDPDVPQLERSTFPGKWSLKFLREQRAMGDSKWHLEWNNRPVPPRGGYYYAKYYVHVEEDEFTPVEVGMFVDPCKLDDEKSDEVGIAIIARDDRGRCAVVYSYGERGLMGEKLDNRLFNLYMQYQGTKFEPEFCAFEDNAVGDSLVQLSRKLAKVLPIETFAQSSKYPKGRRIIHVAGYYQRRKIIHIGSQSVESQQLAFINEKNLAQDGNIDNVTSGILWFLKPEWLVRKGGRAGEYDDYSSSF